MKLVLQTLAAPVFLYPSKSLINQWHIHDICCFLLKTPSYRVLYSIIIYCTRALISAEETRREPASVMTRTRPWTPDRGQGEIFSISWRVSVLDVFLTLQCESPRCDSHRIRLGLNCQDRRCRKHSGTSCWGGCLGCSADINPRCPFVHPGDLRLLTESRRQPIIHSALSDNSLKWEKDAKKGRNRTGRSRIAKLVRRSSWSCRWSAKISGS